MIRRDPTLIALSDNDVQDVRELLRRKAYEKQLAAGGAAAGPAADSASLAAGNSVSSDPMSEYRYIAEKRAALTRLTREQRLGLSQFPPPQQ